MSDFGGGGAAALPCAKAVARLPMKIKTPSGAWVFANATKLIA
jgi:hypothetical protein